MSGCFHLRAVAGNQSLGALRHHILVRRSPVSSYAFQSCRTSPKPRSCVPLCHLASSMARSTRWQPGASNHHAYGHIPATTEPGRNPSTNRGDVSMASEPSLWMLRGMTRRRTAFFSSFFALSAHFAWQIQLFAGKGMALSTSEVAHRAS